MKLASILLFFSNLENGKTVTFSFSKIMKRLLITIILLNTNFSFSKDYLDSIKRCFNFLVAYKNYTYPEIELNTINELILSQNFNKVIDRVLTNNSNKEQKELYQLMTRLHDRSIKRLESDINNFEKNIIYGLGFDDIRNFEVESDKMKIKFRTWIEKNDLIINIPEIRTIKDASDGDLNTKIDLSFSYILMSLLIGAFNKAEQKGVKKVIIIGEDVVNKGLKDIFDKFNFELSYRYKSAPKSDVIRTLSDYKIEIALD